MPVALDRRRFLATRAGAVTLTSGLFLAACQPTTTVVGTGSDLGVRLAARGFAPESTTNSDDLVALAYSGSPDGVVACRSPDGSAADVGARQVSGVVDGRPVVVRQSGLVNARVVLAEGAPVQGTYLYTIERQIEHQGAVVAQQLETLEFGPGEQARASDGTVCGPVI